MSVSIARDHIQSNAGSLRDLNRSLEENASVLRLTEGFLEEKIDELKEIGPLEPSLYWLSLARVNELTLLCAGNYADNFEFSAAGDLLINPRLILVHVKNHTTPVSKERHVKLTEQFEGTATGQNGIIDWFKNETTLETKKKALLPYLFEKMEHSGIISREYLNHAIVNMNKIADTVGFFGCSNFVDSHEFYVRLQNTRDSEKEFLQSKFCRFGTETFEELGADFRRLMKDGNYRSRFLNWEEPI